MVENCAAGGVLMRCLLGLVEETSELAGVLDVEDTAEVWTELEAEDFEDTAEVWTELEAEVFVELEGALELLDAALDWLAELTVDLVLLAVALEWLLDVTGMDEDVLR